MKQYDNVLLVTGGAGFIGSAFLRMLVPKYPNWYFINLDVLTYAGDLSKVESIKNCQNYLFVQGDICNQKLLISLFSEHDINIVVNFAAESHVDNSIKDAFPFIESNINGTYYLLQTAKSFWTDYSNNFKFKFIQISTDEVYGSLGIDSESSNEFSLIAPNSPYSASKAAAELLCRSFYETYSFPVMITRSSNNYGPYQNEEKLIPTILRCVSNSLDIPIYGNGKNVRDWIYVEDNIYAIETVLLSGNIGEVYNIGGKCEMTNIEIANKIMRFYPTSLSKIRFVEDRLGHDFRYSLNIDKISKLGWKPKTSIEDGIAMLVNKIKNS
jgi:dTDP-glucose 4,6-dehydratase